MDRLDLLIYAHDGRGLGHASRSVAIGLAIRRLYPELRVLFVTGMKQSASLIGPGALDWIKLPSYETRVVGGVSKGCHGNSNYSDRELGHIRSGILQDLVTRMKPRCVLSDHMPQGKHRELLAALETSHQRDNALWILGLRGVIGDVKGVWSKNTVSIYKRYYKEIFWYGDRAVLGDEIPDRIAAHFSQVPIETGYVSRLSEWKSPVTDFSSREATLAATVSVPWIGEYTHSFLKALATAVARLGRSFGEWHFYMGPTRGGLASKEVEGWFRKQSYCRLYKMGDGYYSSLSKSRMAVIYGGYNSLTDLLFLRLPGLVILRDMADQEQQEHLRCLTRYSPDQFKTFSEQESNAEILEAILRCQLKHSRSEIRELQLDGADKTASFLGRFIKAQHD